MIPMLSLLLTSLLSPLSAEGPVAREVHIQWQSEDVSPDSLLSLTDPPMSISSRNAQGGSIYSLPKGISWADTLDRLRSEDAVVDVKPLPPRMLEFDRTRVSKMARAIDDWRASWNEFYEVASIDESSPDYLQAKKIPRLGYYESYREWYDARSYPEDEFNWEVYERERAKQDLMDEKAGSGVYQWVNLGPTNVDTPFRQGMGLPPVNGRINALAVHPTNPDIIYAASACGGVWKTTSGGIGWHGFSDDWEALYTSAVAIDPVDPRTIYVGTGDFPGKRGLGIGVMKSTDGGFTWDRLTGWLNNKFISDILIDPDDPDRITVSTGRHGNSKIYQSTNGGQSWFVAHPNAADWYDLAVSEIAGQAERYYYAACINEFGVIEVWRSIDRGENWVFLPVPTHDGQRGVGIDTSRIGSTSVYLYAPTARRVYRSTTAGNSWDNITGNLDQDDQYWGQDFYNFRVSCGIRGEGTDRQDEIWIANIDVMRGTPTGNWEIMGGPAYSNNGLVHVDTHGFAQHPDDNDITFVCNDGGVYSHEEGAGFDELSEKLSCMLVSRMDVHPTDMDMMLGGTQDNGTSVCLGNLNAWYTIVAGDTGHVAINQDFPNLQYAAPAVQLGRNGADDVFIWRTDDTWGVGSGSKITTNVGGDAMRHGTPIAIDPTQTNRVYFASNYLYRYDENTATWDNRLGNQLLSTTGHVFTMAISPSNGDWIYTGATDGEIWRTTDGGQTWDQINMGLPNATVGAISVDPANPARILVGFKSADAAFEKLWECKNTNASPPVWNAPTGAAIANEIPNVPINAIARHPDGGKTHWFVATDIGVFATDDEGDVWYDMTQPFGLPQVEVTDLRAHPNNYLYGSTYGRGFWRIQLLKPLNQFKGG